MGLNSQSVQMILKDQVVLKLQALNLAGDNTLGILPANIQSQEVYDESNLDMPALVVTTQNEKVIPANNTGDTERQDYWFPLWIILADHESEREQSREGDYQEWYFKIKDRFDQKGPQLPPGAQGLQMPLLNPWSINWCVVDEDAKFTNRPDAYQKIKLAMHLKFWVMRSRQA